jgi:hypothetical protein
VLRVRAGAAGRLTVRAPGRRAAIRPARVRVPGPRTLSVTIRPSRAGARLLRRHRRVRVRAAVRFTPVAGAPQRFTRVLTLQRARHR